MQRRIADALRAKEHFARIAHSHNFQASHSTAHIIYFVAITCEGFSFHSVMGGVMCVCSLIAVLGGEELSN
jgi:hypothetical protein